MSEVIVRGERNIKQNRNWFYFKFSVESLYLTIFKRENLILPLKVETPVCHLFGFTRVSSCQILLHFTLRQ